MNFKIPLIMDFAIRNTISLRPAIAAVLLGGGKGKIVYTEIIVKL